jgi:hypothetical protein
MISSPEAVGPVKNNILGVYIGLWGGGGAVKIITQRKIKGFRLNVENINRNRTTWEIKLRNKKNERKKKDKFK